MINEGTTGEESEKKKDNGGGSLLARWGHAIIRKFYYWRMRKFVRMSEMGKRRMNPDQEKCFGIIRNLAAKPESELMIAPISQKFYIRYGDIFVIVERGTVSIINGVYHYDISVSDDLNSKITTFLYKVIERRRAALEAEVRSKIDRSLDYIYYETRNMKGPKKD